MRILERGRVYEDVIAETMEAARAIQRADVVQRILIHLERQTPPDDFRAYGSRVVPFYNYLQAAFVVHEDGRVGADGVLRVAVELVTEHRFDGDALARSYLDLARRGHLRGARIEALGASLDAWLTQGHVPASDELRTMVERLPAIAQMARDAAAGREDDRRPLPDYVRPAGIAAIFRAPLAGALFAAEVLYWSPEFEPEVIIPAGMASVISYCTFALYSGWQPLFVIPTDLGFTNPWQLGPYAILALWVVLLSMLYTRSFYGFTRLVPSHAHSTHFKPAIGTWQPGPSAWGYIMLLAV